MQATADDKTMSFLIQEVKHGQAVDPMVRFEIDQNKFSLQRGCLLRGIGVYVPEVLRKRVLDELHTTYFGITMTKSLAREFVTTRTFS